MLRIYIENDLPVVLIYQNLLTSPFLLLHFIEINLLAFQSNFLSIKLSNNSITRILAKDVILKHEQLCMHITHDYNSDVDDYNSDVENICQ